ncbi:MAG TPA: A24 family peptidase [Pirellulaceae bacterium]|nr:A24 family peptidase [Pirellulaceae bacterium]
MSDLIQAYAEAISNHWIIWLVTVFAIVAAVIDGIELRVPNRLTYPFIIAGWIFNGCYFGWEGLGYSLWGTFVGMMCLLPWYAIGGMGSGDVKMMGGIGAWIYGTDTMWAFGVTVVVGAVLAIGMVLYRGAWKQHENQFWMILNEILTIRDPNKLTVIAAERKKSMLLLPYGIPIAIGTILYFMWNGMLV